MKYVYKDGDLIEGTPAEIKEYMTPTTVKITIPATTQKPHDYSMVYGDKVKKKKKYHPRYKGRKINIKTLKELLDREIRGDAIATIMNVSASAISHARKRIGRTHKQEIRKRKNK